MAQKTGCMQHLFVYGTLMFPAILKGLTGKDFRSEKAILHGFKRTRVTNCDFPAVFPEQNYNVQGLVVFDVDEKSMQVLSFFEGDQYLKTNQQVYTTCKKYEAIVFVWNDSLNLPGTTDWSMEEFKIESLGNYVTNIVPATVSEFQKLNKKSNS